jgi:hypothetical protein
MKVEMISLMLSIILRYNHEMIVGDIEFGAYYLCRFMDIKLVN